MYNLETLFTTNRIRFIRPCKIFINEMIETLNNPDIYCYLSETHKDLTIEDEIIWLENHQKDQLFSMIDLETNEYIGNCGFNEIEDDIGTIGIFITPSFQNQGLGTEAISALIDFGFNKLNLREINLVVFSNNERAIRCYRRLGFEEYNRIHNIHNCNNELVDDIYMRLR
ncbi:MAG: GNAT family N-acetyltransferase, partial [Bacilli bacterium]|nr:GNAT family N-acetyltransferase [Bacilli bacterium]